MSIVLKVKARRPIKVDTDDGKEQLFPGDEFPFDPGDRSHWVLHEHKAIEFVQAENGQPSIADILDRIEAIDGIGPATVAKIREAFDGD